MQKFQTIQKLIIIINFIKSIFPALLLNYLKEPFHCTNDTETILKAKESEKLSLTLVSILLRQQTVTI